MLEDMGGRLRRLREERGLSQRGLAKRSGVSNATISLIERGGMDPSLGLFKRILDALSCSVADFFAASEEVPEPVFFGRDELVEIAGGALSCRQVGRDLRGRPLQILHERYAPGADTGRAMLRHEAFEGGVVVRGEIELTVGRARRLLGPGDAYYFDSRIPHRFRNPGKTECELVSACSPPSF